MNLIHRISTKAIEIMLPLAGGWMPAIKLDQVESMKAYRVNHIAFNPGFVALKPAKHRQCFWWQDHMVGLHYIRLYSATSDYRD